MADQVVIPDVELPADAVMRVFEREVTLGDGASVWLRRFWHDGSRRVYLADGRWCAQRGGAVAHLYAVPLDGTHGGGAVWQYRNVHSYPTWEEALAAALAAEAADRGRGKRRMA